MVGWQALTPSLWARFRSPPPIVGRDAEQYDAVKKVLQQLFVDNRDNNTSRKRVPYRNRHTAQYKDAMRKGNLSAAAWALSHLGVDPDQLNGIALLIAGE